MAITRQNSYQPASSQFICVNGHVRPDANLNLNLEPIMTDSDAGKGTEYWTSWRDGV
ncbi:MAG: hypothetical protein O7G87_11300 [bacterium]|nr:hypothetical protein [bacterium]